MEVIEQDKGPASNQLDGAELARSVSALVAALRSDEGYYISWKSNIAVQFQDAFSNYHRNLGVYDISNIAADNFLKLLCSTIQGLDSKQGQGS